MDTVLMTDAAWQVAGGVLALVGIIGCVVPVLPGPVFSFCAILCLVPTAKCPPTAQIAAFGALAATAVVLDYIVPAIGAKKFNCTRWGTAGCIIGTFAGLFFFPVGLIAGPFLGAFAGELVAGREAGQALRGGIGALIGFLFGTLLKLCACIAMAAAYVRYVL